MAYQGGIGGTFKGLWSPDLTTRAGAMAACESAAFALFVVGGIKVLQLVFLPGLSVLFRLAADGHPAALTLIATIALLFLAAWRLKQGKGLILCIMMAIVYAVQLILFGTLPAWVLGALVLAACIGGIRGANALRRSAGFDDDVRDIFA